MKAEIPIVGGTNTVLVLGAAANVAYPMSAIIRNPGPGTVYLGHKGVTSTEGFPLQTAESLEIDLAGDILYAIATVTTTVYVLRRGD